MEQAQIVLDLFVPADQHATKAVHPTVRPFHHPTPSFESDLPFERLCFLISGSNMQGIAKFLPQLPYFVIVVAIIQAQMLGGFLRRLWSIDGNTF